MASNLEQFINKVQSEFYSEIHDPMNFRNSNNYKNHIVSFQHDYRFLKKSEINKEFFKENIRRIDVVKKYELMRDSEDDLGLKELFFCKDKDKHPRYDTTYLLFII